jgi:hypothetical protein
VIELGGGPPVRIKPIYRPILTEKVNTDARYSGQDRCATRIRLKKVGNESGSVTRWFCKGVGIAAQKYEHGGARFGFIQVLTGKKRGVTHQGNSSLQN